MAAVFVMFVSRLGLGTIVWISTYFVGHRLKCYQPPKPEWMETPSGRHGIILWDHSPCYPDIDINQHLDASGSITL